MKSWTPMSESPCSIEELRHKFAISDDGDLIWRNSRLSNLNGKPAGCVRKDGYKNVNINGRLILNHRVAFAIHNGKWPEKYIDHIDRNRTNNRPDNLREVDSRDNYINRGLQKTNKTGKRGVHFCFAVGKWRAVGAIAVGKRALGQFDTLLDAAAARISWENKHVINRVPEMHRDSYK